MQLDKSVKGTKNARTTFDITGSTTALTGSILASSANASTQKTGQILPSVGISLVPIKEAVAPQKVFDQNQASLVRGSIKRLDYMVQTMRWWENVILISLENSQTKRRIKANADTID